MNILHSSQQGHYLRKVLPTLGASLMVNLFYPLMLFAGEELGSRTGEAAPSAIPVGLTGNQETISLTFAIFKTIGSLIIVVGLMLLLLFWVRKMGLIRCRSSQEGLITIIDSQMLAPKKQVSVIEVAGTYLVVGLTEQQITLLATLEANDHLKNAACSLTQSPPVLPASFASLLNKAVQGLSDLKTKKGGSGNAA